MSAGAAALAVSELSRRLRAFVLERYPLAVSPAVSALDSVAPQGPEQSIAIDAVRAPFARELRGLLERTPVPLEFSATPGVTATDRYAAAVDEIVQACDGLLRRAAIAGSLSADERREILRGMVTTRATDNRLKTLFTGGEVRYADATFQGKGFRSLGQEAIYAAGIRLRRGPAWQVDNTWQGDVVAPMIRDLGLTLAMRMDPETVRMVLSAQMGKSGPPMNGKDLHSGDLRHGILPASAPLATGSLDDCGDGLGVCARGQRPHCGVAHRRGGILAGRVARSDQPLCGSPPAGDFLRPEQPDGALHAGA